jgi:hypothetical protein
LQETQRSLKGFRTGKIWAQALMEQTELLLPTGDITGLDGGGYGMM